MKNLILVLALTLCFMSCKKSSTPDKTLADTTETEMQKKLNKYVSVKLSSDLSKLTDNERQMLPMLIKAAHKMNALFWYEAYGDPSELLNSVSDEETKAFVNINYGPWDRLDGDAAFIEGIGSKPEGANFYPKDMSKEEFEHAEIEINPVSTILYVEAMTGNCIPSLITSNLKPKSPRYPICCLKPQNWRKMKV